MSKYTTLVTVTFIRFLNNQAIDQMVDGLTTCLTSSARLTKNGNFMRTRNAKLFQLPLLNV